jgi:hypothetical protein
MYIHSIAYVYTAVVLGWNTRVIIKISTHPSRHFD